VKLLAADIGNTHVTLGAFAGGKLMHEWRISSRPFRTADEYTSVVSRLLERAGFEPERMILGSVVPPLELEWERVGGGLTIPVRVVRPLHPNLLPLHIDNPEEAGIDRIVDSWAALQKYPAPLLIIDYGTATTFDVVGLEGDYQGGIILPGLELGAEALFRGTALLPQVTVRKPASVIGRNTVDCIRSGLYYGWLEMIRGLVRRVQAEFGARLTVITTGGLAATFADDSDFVDHVEPTLTLDGLCWIDERWEEFGVSRPCSS
jgi:type III pantothenate kinase